MKGLILSSALIVGSMAQAGPYARCGGRGWTGETTCVSGYTCVAQNEWYSQCVAGPANVASAVAQHATTLRTSTRKSCKSTTVHASATQTHKSTTAAAVKPTASSLMSVKSSNKPINTQPTRPTSIPAASSQNHAISLSNAATSTVAVAPATSTASKPAVVTSGSTSSGKSGKFKWFGINQSGAEFGEGNLPGTLDKDYTFPDPAKIDILIKEGYNTFRLSFRMERVAPDGLTGKFNADYLSKLKNIANHITSAGASVALDPHNYGRFSGNVITDTAAFKTFFTNFANEFKSNDKVIFDTNNEYNSMDQDLVLKLNQAAIDGIRSTGAKNWIWAEGNSWSGAHSWTSVNDNMKGLTDPLNKTVYEMHQYLDSDSSGTSETCTSSTIGVERVKDATEWLRTNKKVGMLGEFAGGANELCKEAVTGLLDYLQENSDVWMGASWWAAGPWWGSYMYSFEPETGTGYKYYNEILKTYQ